MVLKFFTSLLFALSILLTPQSVLAAEAETTIPQTNTGEQSLQIEIQNDMNIEASYSLGFGYVYQKSTAARTLLLRNNSYYDMAVYGVSLSAYSFYAVNYCPNYLRGGYQCSIRVFFQPYSGGFHNGYLYIYTNRGTFSVYLYGWGY